MTSDTDDALSWDGDDSVTRGKPALPDGWKAVGKGSESIARPEESTVAVEGEDSDATDSSEPAGLSTAMLLSAGVLGGIYLLFSIGWVVGGLRLKPLANLIVADAMYVPWFVLAVAAPALWFLTTWVLTRGKASWIRLALLFLGVLLLVPWPFVTVGVIGS